MVIELSGVQFCLKSYVRFQNRISAQREFDLKSQVCFQTKIARHEFQLPLYYIHLESHNNYVIAKIQDFSQYQYFVDPVGNKSCKIRHTMVFFVFHFPAI